MAEQVLELRNRSVWQVMASYGIGAWIVLQVADTLSSLIGLPLWFGRALLAVLLAGFVLLLATSVVQGRTAGGTARGFSGLFTWKNMLRAGVGTVALMALSTSVYLGMRSAGIGPIGTLQARGVFEDQERLILADFEGNVEQAGLEETVTTLLRIDLAQSRAFTVLEPVQLAPVLARMQRSPTEQVTYDVALEAARREGIKAIVAGDLLQAGPAIVVSARIVAASSGEVLVAVRETADDVSEVPERVDRLSAQLRERIGESLRTIQGDQPLERVTTASLQALEKYAQADRANNLGDTPRAMALLEEALAEDSTFAMAHRKLGILLNNLGIDDGRLTAAFTRAYELRDRLSDRERWLAEAGYLAYVAEDERGSMDRYITLLESYPTDPIALNNLALAYRGLGRTQEASELYLRSIRQGGAPATTYSGSVAMQYQLGDTSGARRTLDEYERAYPDNADVSQTRVALLSARFDYAGAEAGARRAVELTRGTAGEGASLLTLAQLHLLQGRVEEAMEEFRDAVTVMEARGTSANLSFGLAEALVVGSVELFYTERPEDAVRVMDEARAAHGIDDEPLSMREDPQFALLYAYAGRPDRARALMDAYSTDGGPEGGRWLQARSAIALSEGESDRAIDLLHAAREESPGCALCGLPELGRSFDVAQRPDSAMHYLEEYLAVGDLARLQNSDNLMFWYVVPRLGELHAENGDPERARELLSLFLDATTDADAAYAAKRDRLRALLEAVGG